MSNSVKTLLILAIFFTVNFLSTNAKSWPPEVKPEQGHALGTISFECVDRYSKQKMTVTQNVAIDFWNVGKFGTGQDYSGMTITETQVSPGKNNGCQYGSTYTASFEGGPNGKIDTGPVQMKVVDGQYIEYKKRYQTYDLGQLLANKYVEVWHEASANIPIQNPKVFSNYRWSMDQAAPIPEIEQGKFEVEAAANARFNDLSGQVEINIPLPDGTYDEEAWNLAKIDMELPPGTRIKVFEESSVMLALSEHTSITVGPETEIILVSPEPQKSEIKLLLGNLKANVRKMMKDGSMEVEMSQAVAGIKGTTFTLEDTKDKSTIKVTEGSVSYKSMASGQTEMVNAGEMLSADKNGLGQKTVFNTNEENAKWDNFTAEMKKSADTEKTGTDSKKYLYYVGILALLAVIITAFFVVKRKL